MQMHDESVGAFIQRVEGNRNKRACYVCGKEPIINSPVCQEHYWYAKQVVRLFGRPLKPIIPLTVVPAPVTVSPSSQSVI